MDYYPWRVVPTPLLCDLANWLHHEQPDWPLTPQVIRYAYPDGTPWEQDAEVGRA